SQVFCFEIEKIVLFFRSNFFYFNGAALASILYFMIYEVLRYFIEPRIFRGQNREDESMKNISILGSTGSIGLQTLNVVREDQNEFQVLGLSTNVNIDLLEKQ